MAPHPPTEVLLPFVGWLYGTPTPRPYGLLSNMSESSGTPGENLARGSFSWPAYKKKLRQRGGAKVASDTGRAGRGRSPGPWHCLTVGRRARLFPDFNPPRSAPATADKPNAQRAPNEVKSSVRLGGGFGVGDAGAAQLGLVNLPCTR